MCEPGLPVSGHSGRVGPHPTALSLCPQSQPWAEVGDSPVPAGQQVGRQCRPAPAHRAELGSQETWPEVIGWPKVGLHGLWPPRNPESGAPTSCPTYSFDYLARDGPVVEVCHAGLGSPRLRALVGGAEPCQGSTCPVGGGREQCLASELWDRPWSTPLRIYTHTPCSAYPREAHPFSLPTVNLCGQVYLVHLWARKHQ